MQPLDKAARQYDLIHRRLFPYIHISFAPLRGCWGPARNPKKHGYVYAITLHGCVCSTDKENSEATNGVYIV